MLLGDSWTENNKPVFSTLQQLNPNTEWHNYGVSGYIVQQLPDEINVARQDATLHPEEITDVIIVIGTNNVFWKNLNGHSDITEQDAYNAFTVVRNFFQNANIHLFPDNSKTLNEGRNGLYRNINTRRTTSKHHRTPRNAYTGVPDTLTTTQETTKEVYNT